MPPVSRAPNIPRKIRNLKPKRQLPRNERANDRDDEWWHNNIGAAQKSTSAQAGVHLRGVARFRPRVLDASISEEAPENEHENEANRTNDIATPMRIWENFKSIPTRKKIKRFIAGMVLFTALKSIYFADLDDYQYPQKGVYPDAQPSLSTTKKTDSGLSSLRSNVGDVKSLSELLGDDFVGKRGESYKSSTKTMGGELGQNYGKNKFGSPNNNSGMQSASSSSFGGKSMSDSFGSLGQSNFGSSNNIGNGSGGGMESASFSSFGGKSMSDSFVSSGQSNFGSSNNSGSGSGSGMESASFSLIGGKVSFPTNSNNMHSASFNSYSSQDGNLQSSFHSYSDTQYQAQKSLQSPNLSVAQDSGQYFQGLRGKSTDTSSGNGVFGSDQFLNEKNAMSDRQSNLIARNVMRTGLECAPYGGPHSEEEYSELVYWRDISLDATFASPYYNPLIQESKAPPHRTKYLTFEMDGSGWNNIRLSFENMMLLAHSMGRTLVMPPKRQIAHGMPDIHGSKTISFDDFYDINAISAKQNGLNIISMEEFLEREAVNGNLNSMATGAAIYPPNNQVNWNNQRLEPLWSYISAISRTFNWNPKECVLAFPAKGTDDQQLFSMMADVLIEKDGRPFPDYGEFQGKPVNVDGPTIERFREVLAGRRKICLYDSKMHAENDVVHFKAEENEQRLILPFYAFMFWEDWRQQSFALRFARDNLVYNDEIFCLAARMVNTIRDYVRQRSPENGEGLYDAIHVRRRDFQSQFPMTEMSADKILAEIRNEIEPASTIYIATDERDPTFFDPLREVYDLKFIGDFGDMLKGVNPQLFGLAEQIVASRSRLFFGTYYSSFSAYIVRLRGYYSVKEKQPGYLSGALQNTYYLGAWKKEMSMYQAVHVPFYAREFPIAWRDIDKL